MIIYLYPIILLLVMLGIVLIFDYGARLRNKRTGEIDSYYMELMRKGSHTSAYEKRFFFFKMRSGALKYTWLFCLGVTPLYYFKYFQLYTISMLIYSIPDALAALLGRYFGKPVKILGNKSIIGFLAYTLSAGLIIYFSGIGIAFSLAIAAALAVVELYARGGSDNFFCPILAMVFLYFLGVR